jgi:hypothetical protein
MQGTGVGGWVAWPTPCHAATQGWYQVPDALEPRTIVITGSNTGIGFASASSLAAAGHDVHLVCRTLQKAEQSCSNIKARFPSEVYFSNPLCIQTWANACMHDHVFTTRP